MTGILNWLKGIWDFINRLHPETRSLIIMLLFGYVLYSQINKSTSDKLKEQQEQTVKKEKDAENYTKKKASEINRHIRLIAHRDADAFDVLLLSYHNNTESLSGLKFLYLSCLTEAPRSIDTPLLKSQWTSLDYIYYVDELERIHNQEIVQIEDISKMKYSLPKLYRLVQSSDANAAAFYVIEGKKFPIGIIVVLYHQPVQDYTEKAAIVMPSIQKLAILLDYGNK